jgi:ADP-heptose:LPS heptosyltransferase
MKILFITATRIGDAVISTGLLNHLVTQNSGAQITVACGPLAESIFTAVPGLERVIVLSKTAFSGHWFRLWNAVRLIIVRPKSISVSCANQKRNKGTTQINNDVPSLFAHVVPQSKPMAAESCL